MDDQPFIRLDWIVDNLGAIGQRLGEHLQMTAIAVVVGFAVRLNPVLVVVGALGATALLVRREGELFFVVNDDDRARQPIEQPMLHFRLQFLDLLTQRRLRRAASRSSSALPRGRSAPPISKPS